MDLKTHPILNSRSLCSVEDATASDTAAAGGTVAPAAATVAATPTVENGGTVAAPAADLSLLGGESPGDKEAAAKVVADAAKAKADAEKTGALAPEVKLGEDGKPIEAKADEKAEKEPAKVEGAEVPEGTPFTLKAPEGFEGLDETALSAAQPILRELGIKTNEAAQGVVDRFAKDVLPGMLERAMTAQKAGVDQAVADIRKDWAEKSRSDEEFGGNPDKLNANVALGLRFRDRFGTPALTELLNMTGIGNHPEVIRLFVKAGKAISEGSFHVSDHSAQVRGGPETRMYAAEFQPKS